MGLTGLAESSAAAPGSGGLVLDLQSTGTIRLTRGGAVSRLRARHHAHCSDTPGHSAVINFPTHSLAARPQQQDRRWMSRHRAVFVLQHQMLGVEGGIAVEAHQSALE